MADITDFLPSFGDLGEIFTDPTLLTGLGAQAAGTYLQAERLRRIRQRQKDLLAAERARQAALQAEADARIKGTTQQLSFGQQEVDRNALARTYEQKFSPAVAAEAEYTNNPGAPSIVKTELGRQMAEAARKGAEHAKNTAELASYAGQGLNNQVVLNRLNQDVGRVAGFSSGRSALVPYQLQAQLGKEKGYGVASDVLSGLGDLFVKSALTRPDPNRPRIPRQAKTGY